MFIISYIIYTPVHIGAIFIALPAATTLFAKDLHHDKKEREEKKRPPIETIAISKDHHIEMVDDESLICGPTNYIGTWQAACA